MTAHRNRPLRKLPFALSVIAAAVLGVGLAVALATAFEGDPPAQEATSEPQLAP